MLSTGKLPLGGMPWNIVVRITECLDMVSSIYRGHKTTNKTPLQTTDNQFSDKFIHLYWENRKGNKIFFKRKACQLLEDIFSALLLCWKVLQVGIREHTKGKKIADSVWLSLFMISNDMCNTIMSGQLLTGKWIVKFVLFAFWYRSECEAIRVGFTAICACTKRVKIALITAAALLLCKQKVYNVH